VSQRNDRTNGFRVRGLTPVDRLAVQSNVQTTFFLSRGLLGLPKWHEIGLTRSELIVLRAYKDAPVIEIEGLGGPFGVLIVEATQQFTRTLRNGQRLKIAMKKDESVVIKNEYFAPPRREGASVTRV
jgi:hypothetical protein